MIRPILIITLGFIIGILLGLYLNVAPIIFLVLIFFTTAINFINYKRSNCCIRIIKIFIKNNIILTCLISAFISSIYLAVCNKKFEKFYNEFNATGMTVTIISNNKETEYKNTYKVRIEDFKRFKDINLILRISKSKKITLNYGDKIKVSGEYIIPEEARNYGGFNYKEYLKTQKVYGIFDADKVEILEHRDLSFI